MTKANKMVKCDGCNEEHRSRNVIRFKGKMLCVHCRLKRENTKMNQRIPHFVAKEEALDRVYEVKPIVRKDGYSLGGQCCFPRILIGAKFKIKIVEVDNT